MKWRFLSVACGALLLAACSSAPRPVATQDEKPIRAAALEFAGALKSGNGSRMRGLAVGETDPEKLALTQAVVADTLKSRELQLNLEKRFGEMEALATIAGTDAWIRQWEDAAAKEPIMQAGNRVRIGEAGREGCLFLRQIDGRWRVEIVPTMVAEFGGRSDPADSLVRYRLGTTLAVNAYMLERLKRGEFATLADYQRAKNQFWFQYMAYAANGDDPREKLLPTLPPLPVEPNLVAEDR